MTISPIYALIKAEVDREGNAFLKQKIDPWLFFNVKGVNIEKSDGSQINISGFEFSGSARLVFWDGFVDEELTALALSLFEDARTKAIEHDVPIESSILACNDCLSGLVLRVFERMADIDQRLRGKGYPNSVSKENVGERASNLCRVIEKFAEAHIASAKAGKNGSMQKTITFIDYKFKRDFDTDNLVGWFNFSAIDSSLAGTPREHSTTHTLKLIITEELMDYWRLAGASNAIVTDDMTRVSFQIAEDYISEQIKKNTLPSKMPPLFLNTENSPTSCPYKISNITYPSKTAFVVEIDNKVTQPLARCLADFANHIKAEMRMTFWQFDKTKKKYKWVSQPEQRGKDLLRTHLNGRFGDSFYTLEEISAGAGMIDLYIITPSGEKAIVELKMCGHGYTKKWALGGIEQLFHYMENKRTTTGYLIVFDSRVRDFSIGFPPTESDNGMIVTTIIIDLRPYVKREDAPDNV